MSSFSIRLPDHLHEELRRIAEEDNVSMNHFITLAVAEKIAAYRTIAYLEERAARGSREMLRELLDRVPDAPPVEGDQLS